MRPYGQFCPVAKAAEIFAERWTPLIVRELLLGSHRFRELEMGLPGIPRSLLVSRLRSLERAGVVVRRPKGRRTEYDLTAAGGDLYEVVMRLGEWGQRWVNHEIGDADLDPSLLMWDMRRRVNVDRLPEQRVVVQVDFLGAKTGTFWLVLENPDPSVCLTDPGFDVDLVVTADTLTLHQVWMGHESLEHALRAGLVRIEGPSNLARAFPRWLALSTFAAIKPASPVVAG